VSSKLKRHDGSNEFPSLPAHLEALFKITHSSNFNTSVQAMMLIQQICSSHQGSTARLYKTLYESLLDVRLITSSKHSLYLNLLHRALKADTNVKRVKAFAKRILQMLALHQPSFVCGCFFLLQELRHTFPGLSALIDQPEEHDLEDEIYEDVQEPGDGTPPPRESQPKCAGDHAYDGRKRDPEHSNAENSCLWEVIPFLAHFHPSVSVSAEHIMQNAKLPGKPDLELHTLIHFLDRFVYRNAKLGTSNLRGSSIMQPLAGGDSATLLVSSAGPEQLPVNSEKFWNKRSEDVPAEDAFFHQYFNSLGKPSRDRRTGKKIRKSPDDEASEGEESEIWKAMMESAPDLEGADDTDQDLDMSDLESAFEGSNSEASQVDEEGAKDMPDLWVRDASSDLDLQSGDGSADSESDNTESIPVRSTKDRKGASGTRRKLKKLPTFASATDYAKMIDGDEGEDWG
jgi:ribosome biogenesis protein MAK21